MSEQLTHTRALRDHDLTIYDLAWTPSHLKEQFHEHTADDAELDERLADAVATWRERVAG